MPQQMTHDELDAMMWRARHMPETLSAAESLLVERGSSDAQSATAYAAMMGSAGGDAYNPTASYAASAREAQQFTSVTLASSQTAKPVPTERQRVRAMGHRDREAYRLASGTDRAAFRRWLWADEPRPAAPSSTPQAIQWAEAVLRPGAA